MAQRARQEAPDARIFEAQWPPCVNLEPGLLVIAEGSRMIEGAGVHPQPIDRPGPRPVDRRLQQKRTEPPADEFGDQSEIGQLRLARIGCVQLEITGRNAADIENEDLGGVLRYLRAERLIVEQTAL